MTVYEHTYGVTVRWTGNTGSGTSGYRDYSRAHTVDVSGKPPIPGSSDPQFSGDHARWNPEELLVAALAACHKLWYLHLCADAGVVVTAYVDRAQGFMSEDASGGGRFTRVVLHPEVEIRAGADVDLATRLHHEAHKLCFIANSVNFPVDHVPTVVASGQDPDALSPSQSAAPDQADCVNETCPWSGDPVRSDSLMRFQDRVVGFCNPSCRDKFARAVAHFESAGTADARATTD